MAFLGALASTAHAAVQCVEEQKLTALDATASNRFGGSVSVSKDTAVVGAEKDECAPGDECGAAYVFRFNGTDWVEEQKLIGSDTGAYDVFGESVAVSGATILVGAGRKECVPNRECGAAYVFRFDGNAWVEGQKLVSADLEIGDRFGASVFLDGNTAIIGAPGENCNVGS